MENAKVDLPEPRRIKTCDSCGATYPWHFNDCRRVPGGELLYAANLEDKRNWEREKWVPREKGVKILKAILYMMTAKDDKDHQTRKEAILEEIKRL